MSYLYLAMAIVSEVIGTAALKASEEFTRPVPALIMALGYASAFFFLTLTLRHRADLRDVVDPVQAVARRGGGLRHRTYRLGCCRHQHLLGQRQPLSEKDGSREIVWAPGELAPPT